MPRRSGGSDDYRQRAGAGRRPARAPVRSVLFRSLGRTRRRSWLADGMVAGPSAGGRRRPDQPAGGDNLFRTPIAVANRANANSRRMILVSRDAEALRSG